MPELPEVETIARGVDARVRGGRIAQAWFGSHREPFKTPPAQQAKGLEGRRFLSVHRTGKHIVCGLSGVGEEGRNKESDRDGIGEIGAQWIVHLGMTGRLLVTSPSAPVDKHTHARLTLSGGRESHSHDSPFSDSHFIELRFIDPRRFGRLEFRDLQSAAGFGSPGADPLAIGAEAFAVLFRGRKLSIKAALLNQSLLAGVGNIYADESLFRAGIRPTRRAGRLTRAERERLRVALRQVLLHAIRLGGSSVSDYVDADGERGLFQLRHNVYMRTGQPCRRCGTPIRRIVLAGRGTHFCPVCQRREQH